MNGNGMLDFERLSDGMFTSDCETDGSSLGGKRFS